MRIQAIVGAASIILFCAGPPTFAASPPAEPADDSATLAELLEQIRHALPPGWRAEMTPDVPLEIRLPCRRDDLPCLVAWRTALTPAEIVAPGRSPDPSYEPVRVVYQL